MFTKLSEPSASGGNHDESEPDPKPAKNPIKRGRTQQKKLAKTQVIHTMDVATTEARGLKCLDGQCEEFPLITVVPSKLVIETHKRQKYFEWDPETGTHKIVTADGPMKLKEGSRYSIDFAVEVGLSKYRYHLPLDRQRHLLGEQGLAVSFQVL
jgi:transposase